MVNTAKLPATSPGTAVEDEIDSAPGKAVGTNSAGSFLNSVRNRSSHPCLRANWKGFLRLSLVTCPVALPRHFRFQKISFNQINRNTGQRIKYTLVELINSK
jgi:hypothetical protein